MPRHLWCPVDKVVGSGWKWDTISTEWQVVGICDRLVGMLIGEYIHTLDNKKRVALPSKFRRELGRKIILTRGLDNCIFMYPEIAWRKVLEKLEKLSTALSNSRDFNRFMLSGAVETEVDRAGRILIPDFLKDFAGLETRVIVAGVGDRLELWNFDSWQSYKKRVGRQAGKLAEKLGQVGGF